MYQPIRVKVCKLISRRLNFIIHVQNFGRPSPKKISGVKNMQKLAPFPMTSNFGGKYLQNKYKYSKSDKYLIDSDSFHVRQKKSGEFWSSTHEDLKVKLYPSKRLFWMTIFRPLRSAASQIFTHAREWPNLASTHPSGMGVPLTIKLQCRLKISLNFSVLAVRTFEPEGVASRNLATWHAARYEW